MWTLDWDKIKHDVVSRAIAGVFCTLLGFGLGYVWFHPVGASKHPAVAGGSAGSREEPMKVVKPSFSEEAMPRQAKPNYGEEAKPRQQRLSSNYESSNAVSPQSMKEMSGYLDGGANERNEANSASESQKNPKVGKNGKLSR